MNFQKLIRQYPITSFLIINYTVSWTFLYPAYQLILADPNGNLPPVAWFGMIGGYGPVIAAILITRITEGKLALKQLLKSLLIWKVSYWCYAFVIFVPILIYLFSTAISFLLGYPVKSFDLVNGISSIPISFLIALPFGPMGEELGWRGYLLPKMMTKYSALKSSILVGLAWGLWHLASFTFPGAALPGFMGMSLLSIGVYFCYTIAESLVFTFIYLRTKASVFIAILLHAFFNASSNIQSSFFEGITDKSHNVLIYCLTIAFTAIIGLILLSPIMRKEHLQRAGACY